MGYKAFGFNIVSEIPLSALETTIADESYVDVEVEIGDLSTLWSELSTPGNSFVFKDEFVLFQVPNIATYLIKDGKKIIVSPMKGVTLEKTCLFINGYCMAIVLLQREIFPLHGSAVVMNGKAYAIIGHSGAGKSTLTKALLNKGFYFLTDDVIPITLSSESNHAMVMPAFPEQKLWEDSLNGFGMESSELRAIYQSGIEQDQHNSEIRTKFAIPVSQFADKPVPLAGIFEIVKTEESADIGIYPMQRMEQFQSLINHTYLRSLIPFLGLMECHFKTTAGLLNRTEVYKIKRSTSDFTALELVSLIIKTIDKENENGEQYLIGS